MVDRKTCPICLDVDGTACRLATEEMWDKWYDCQVCGRFQSADDALEDYLASGYKKLSLAFRGYLSHVVRLANGPARNAPKVTPGMIDAAMADGKRLPLPSQQATNALRFIGDAVLEEGAAIDELPPEFRAIIGSPNRNFADKILRDLINQQIIDAIVSRPISGHQSTIQIEPTLHGWALFEAEQRGQIAGKYGFIALQFGDDELDPFLASVIKPAVASIGYDLVDLRETARAGIIDNVMRAQIRDAAFVLVDLTHANSGAYWEAGYAEGVGKPVLYLCKKSVFEERQTHFDTNHCTTVMWEIGDPEKFSADLTATLRRSLDLFA